MSSVEYTDLLLDTWRYWSMSLVRHLGGNKRICKFMMISVIAYEKGGGE